MIYASNVTAVSRRAATKAGRGICLGAENIGENQYENDVLVAQQWRAQHVKPSQKCFGVLLDAVSSIPNAVCTYRLKRFSSIMNKLRRPGTHFELGALDDIGGCRVIVDSPSQVDQVVLVLKSNLDFKGRNPEKDYIREPQKSGYRSHHLFAVVEDEGARYRVEIQVRTRLEHYWATAVEAMSEIYGHDYKSPPLPKEEESMDAERREFLTAVSALFALREGTSPVPGSEGLAANDVIRRLKSLSCLDQLMIDLRASADSVFQPDAIDDGGGGLFLLEFSRENQNLDVERFAVSELRDALRRYDSLERDIEGFTREKRNCIDGGGAYDNVVLSYAQNPEQLSVAYPNYSANVNLFTDMLKQYGI